jgi:uncharacterized protein YndB with AHSA1/START domain
MIDIIHRVGIKAPVSKVYAALSTIEGVAGWWTKETTGVSKPGGTIEFEFSTLSGERFGHVNWREAVEFTAHCSTKWATFLLSLRDLVEAGKGRPAPNDIQIGNWH